MLVKVQSPTECPICREAGPTSRHGEIRTVGAIKTFPYKCLTCQCKFTDYYSMPISDSVLEYLYTEVEIKERQTNERW